VGLGLITDRLEQLSLLFNLTDADAWQKRIKFAAAYLGFNQMLFELLAKTTSDIDSTFVVSNYSADWQDRYDQCGYVHIDPAVTYSLQNVSPLVWRDKLYNGEAQRNFREEAKAHGLAFGITFPLHGPNGEFGIFNLSLDKSSEAEALRTIQRTLGELLLLKDAAFQSVLKLPLCKDAAAGFQLTKREQEILQWSAIGKTAWEISRICNCSEANINFHLSNVRRKFGVRSSRAAALRAYSLKLINL